MRTKNETMRTKNHACKKPCVQKAKPCVQNAWFETMRFVKTMRFPSPLDSNRKPAHSAQHTTYGTGAMQIMQWSTAPTGVRTSCRASSLFCYCLSVVEDLENFDNHTFLPSFSQVGFNCVTQAPTVQLFPRSSICA